MEIRLKKSNGEFPSVYFLVAFDATKIYPSEVSLPVTSPGLEELPEERKLLAPDGKVRFGQGLPTMQNGRMVSLLYTSAPGALNVIGTIDSKEVFGW